MSEETVSTEAITDEEIEELLRETSESEEEVLQEKTEEDEEPFEDDDDQEEDDEDEDEDEEEGVKESLTKPAMVRAIFNQLQDTKKTKLESHFDKIMHSLTTLEEDDDLDEAKDDPNVADPDEIFKSVDKTTEVTKKVKAGKKGDKGEKTRLKAEDVDFSADIAAMFNDEVNLSDDFKSKAAIIFEAALIAKVNEELEKIESKFDEELTEAREENLTDMTEKVDEYLSYAVDEWQKENELAITKGLQAEISEEFITGLRNLFAEHYIEIPDEKLDVADTLADRVDKLEGELNESIERTIDMQKQINEYQKTELLIQSSDGLVDTEYEKLKELSEGVDFEDVEQYANALGTLRENYFPKTGTTNQQFIVEEQEVEGGIFEETTGTMSAYVGALARTQKNVIQE